DFIQTADQRSSTMLRVLCAAASASWIRQSSAVGWWCCLRSPSPQKGARHRSEKKKFLGISGALSTAWAIEFGGHRLTFSIAARCPRTRLIGAAVTTSSIAVGSRCLFARGDAGAVLTQHRTDPSL